jgi:hypothetical protein
VSLFESVGPVRGWIRYDVGRVNRSAWSSAQAILHTRYGCTPERSL